MIWLQCRKGGLGAKAPSSCHKNISLCATPQKKNHDTVSHAGYSVILYIRQMTFFSLVIKQMRPYMEIWPYNSIGVITYNSSDFFQIGIDIITYIKRG